MGDDTPGRSSDRNATRDGGERDEGVERSAVGQFDARTIPARGRASPGRVYLIGAGPGDPDLLTVRARWLLETADVVLHDALVRDALLERLPDAADVVDVGKRVAAKTPQSEINARLVERARAGDAVVRLKGGDPFVFGRGGEEAQHLAARGVPFQVVPGISSAIGAPGIAGIPLTHRDVSSQFIVITGHETPDKDESALDWDAISTALESGATLVVLMGVRTLERNVNAVRTHGVAGDRPAALVQQATWTDQRVVRGTVETIAERADDAGVSPPATAILGDAAAIRDEIEAELAPFDLAP